MITPAKRYTKPCSVEHWNKEILSPTRTADRVDFTPAMTSACSPSQQMVVAGEGLVEALDQLRGAGIVGRGIRTRRRSGGRRRGRRRDRRFALGQVEGEVERSQHRDAVARLHLARIADLAHRGIDALDGFAQLRLAAFGAAEQIALAH